MRVMLHHSSKTLLCAFLAALMAAAVWAQVPVGTISGTVTDESGAVVPGVTITARNKATSLERSVTSSSEGSYSIPALAAGEYEVTFKMNGFRTLQQEAVVSTGTITGIDAQDEGSIFWNEATSSADFAADIHTLLND